MASNCVLQVRPILGEEQGLCNGRTKRGHPTRDDCRLFCPSWAGAYRTYRLWVLWNSAGSAAVEVRSYALYPSLRVGTMASHRFESSVQGAAPDLSSLEGFNHVFLTLEALEVRHSCTALCIPDHVSNGFIGLETGQFLRKFSPDDLI